MADFPEPGRAQDTAEAVGTAIGVLLILAFWAAVIWSLFCIFHGLYQRDSWEMAGGFAGVFGLGVLAGVVGMFSRN